MWLSLRILAAAVLLATGLSAQTGFFLREGDVVVFYGDSITDQRLYTNFVETFVTTRFPALHVRFIHSGWSGDRVDGGAGGSIDVRLNRDVLVHHPSVVTVMLGMNDGHYHPFDPTSGKTFVTGYEHIIQTVKTALPNARITLLQTSPYDDVTRPAAFPGGYNEALLRYSDFLPSLAKREQLMYADLNTSLVSALRKVNAANPGLARELIPDRVHPGPAASLVMAESLLKAWNAPALVSAVEVDAAAGKTTRSENTVVSDLSTQSGVRWTQLDSALPMAVDPSPLEDLVKLVLASTDFTETLNQETLRVRGLPPGAYDLKIDGERIATFSDEQLAESINLANLTTPMSRQADEVLLLTYRHNHLHFARWRMIETGLDAEKLPSTPVAMEALDKLEGELIAMRTQKAIPRAHHYEIKAVRQASPP
jgi:lysophospholipase L1-like esterase